MPRSCRGLHPRLYSRLGRGPHDSAHEQRLVRAPAAGSGAVGELDSHPPGQRPKQVTVGVGQRTLQQSQLSESLEGGQDFEVPQRGGSRDPDVLQRRVLQISEPDTPVRRSGGADSNFTSSSPLTAASGAESSTAKFVMMSLRSEGAASIPSSMPDCRLPQISSSRSEPAGPRSADRSLSRSPAAAAPAPAMLRPRRPTPGRLLVVMEHRRGRCGSAVLRCHAPSRPSSPPPKQL